MVVSKGSETRALRAFRVMRRTFGGEPEPETI
jgi:hypothetical protein